MASSFGNATARRARAAETRSEEHTSELQSRLHLVCRLLLEKKKNHNPQLNSHTTIYYQLEEYEKCASYNYHSFTHRCLNYTYKVTLKHMLYAYDYDMHQLHT